ncbi:alpha-glucosidase [Pelobium manganitolerans]|uniref:Alpha-glucosidase n=1 Tax=Pelobium manganitolerans TaxID=1842495 RepID=A0A419S697_9SPHI|nr:glycoside hydrolase family 97 protein [Pelobium manganitolerans]RKD16365.1 alpha-glucosidase [Pelobium manganitolerans]
MKKHIILSLIALCSVLQLYAKEVEVSSPDKTLKASLTLNSKGQLFYRIFKNGQQVLEYSKLGLIRADQDFLHQLKFVSVSKPVKVTDHYQLAVAKRFENNYEANKLVFTVSNAQKALMEVIFQVSDDGVAFRYHFPNKSSGLKEITSEATSFNFPAEAKAWLQPMAVAKTGWSQTNPSYEEFYEKEIQVGTPAPLKAGWVYPALFKSNGTWVLITETFPDKDYCGTRLSTESPAGEYTVTFPDQREVIPGKALNPISTLPWYSPWRILAVGSLKTIVESTLGTDLAKPAKIKNVADFKPGISSWSWVMLKDDSTVYDVQKKFIDYAADMNWDYCLVDADWHKKIGRDKIAELSKYAQTKNVALILWYNSAGNWNTVPYGPKDFMLTEASRDKEFAWLQSIGVKGVKVDFFGGDGQSMMAYYEDILTSAAKYGVSVNCHGSTLPRGLQRTFPNLMTMEAIRGMEFRTFEQKDENVAASHIATIPFTRNVFDPMDYTPMALGGVPRFERGTTSAMELATAVLFQSGVTHMAETPTRMAKAPAYVQDLLKHLPKHWDDIRFVDGYPGKYCVLARKAGNKWYIAGINGEKDSKELNLDLSFLPSTSITMITEGKDAMGFSSASLQGSTKVKVTLNPHGGFLMLSQ